MASSTVTIVNPVVADPEGTGKLVPTLQGVEGTSVGIRVMWRSFGLFVDHVEGLLTERHGISSITKVDIESQVGGKAAGMHASKEQLDTLAAKADWAILGLAG